MTRETGKLAEVPGCAVRWRGVSRHVAVEGTSEWGNVGAAAGAERWCCCGVGGLWVDIYSICDRVKRKKDSTRSGVLQQSSMHGNRGEEEGELRVRVPGIDVRIPPA